LTGFCTISITMVTDFLIFGQVFEFHFSNDRMRMSERCQWKVYIPTRYEH
jgi:hypothetical protein